MRYALPVRENIGLGRHERLPDDEYPYASPPPRARLRGQPRPSS